MALVTSQGFDLVPDLNQSVQSGLQTAANVQGLQANKQAMAARKFANLDAETQTGLKNFSIRSAQAMTLPKDQIDAFLQKAIIDGANQDPPVDMSDTQGILNTFRKDPQAGIAQLQKTAQFGKDLGFIGQGTTAAQREFDQMTKGFSEADKLSARRINVGLDPRAVGSAAQTITEKGTAEDVGASEAIVKGTVEEEVGSIKGKQQRLNALGSTRAGRMASIKKARKFLDLFKNRNMKSGAGRTAARYLPGVYTDQGKLDEEFNSFSEVAARQALKASGEIRPTDADVEGMKRAMFGIGRDESVNMILLEDYLEQQELDDEEYKALKSGKTPVNRNQPVQPEQQTTQAAQPASQDDIAALEWARANPNDPRAVQIMQIQGAQ